MNEAMGKETQPEPRTWQIWERPMNPRPFQLTERDIEIIRLVFLHRFLQPVHIHALLGGSRVNLERRCRLLWLHGYLERPKSLRPTRTLTDQLVYGLGKQGAKVLQHLDPSLRIAHLDWTETPKKQAGFPYIDHQLGIATTMVALKVGCDQAGMVLQYDGHFFGKGYRIELPGEGEVLRPDAHFSIYAPGRGVAHHYLEVDRANVRLEKMRERYWKYFWWWRDGRERRAYRDFRVLTLVQDPGHVESLRRAAIPVGRDADHPNTWKGLWFSHLQAFDLQNPERILGPIFLYADEDRAVSLV